MRYAIAGFVSLTLLALGLVGPARADVFAELDRNDSGASTSMSSHLEGATYITKPYCPLETVPNGGTSKVECLHELDCTGGCSTAYAFASFYASSAPNGTFALAGVIVPAYGDPYFKAGDTLGNVSLQQDVEGGALPDEWFLFGTLEPPTLERGP